MRVPFLVVAIAWFATMAGANLATPLYAVYEREFGFSSAVLTVVFATYMLVLAPALLVFGQLSDRFGRRRVMAAGFATATLGLLTFAAAQSLPWLFAARCAAGPGGRDDRRRRRRRARSSSTPRRRRTAPRCSPRSPRPAAAAPAP